MQPRFFCRGRATACSCNSTKPRVIVAGSAKRSRRASKSRHIGVDIIHIATIAYLIYGAQPYARNPVVKVLIADDHPVVRHGLKQILAADPDLEVVAEARNGSDALELARNHSWDVAILDYSMPGRSGIELLKDFRREFPDRPVLILSIYPEELHATRVLKAGGAGYINKQSASEELTAAIRKVVQGGKYVSPTLAEKLAFDTISDAQQPPHETLSDREYRVMWLIASGMQIHEIAKEMFVSPSTVSTYRARILKKLSVGTNAELVRYAIRHRLIA